MLGGEGPDYYFLVLVNHTGFDFMRTHLPSFRVGTLVSARSCAVCGRYIGLTVSYRNAHISFPLP
jgi:hypothetical protein